MWILKTRKNDLHLVVLCRKLWLSDPYHSKSPGAQNQLLSLSGKLENSPLLLCKAFNTYCKTLKKKWISLGQGGILASLSCWIGQQKEAWNQKEERKYFSSIFSVFNERGEKGTGWYCFVVETFSTSRVVWSPGEEGDQWLWCLVNFSPILWSELLVWPAAGFWGQACASSPSAHLQIVTVGRP